MKEKLKIFVVTHVPPLNKLPKNYEYILGGKFNKIDGNILGHKTHDDIENNISDKNIFYSELTCLYVINDLIKRKEINFSYVGLTHYRRFFINNFSNIKLNFLKRFKNIDAFKDIKYFLLNEEYFSGENKIDLYLPNKTKFRNSVLEQYAQAHQLDDLILALNTVQKIYPDYSEVISKFKIQKYIYCCNMFIAKPEVINSYCDWVFPILEKIESSVQDNKKGIYQKRVLGFLGERLFNLWVNYHKKSLKIRFLPLARIDNAKN